MCVESSRLGTTRIKFALLGGLLLSSVEALVVEGLRAFRLWDLSPTHQLLVTGLPWWFVMLLVASFVAGRNEKANWKPVVLLRRAFAVTWLCLVILFAGLALLSYVKVGYFPSPEHLRFGLENLLRVQLHVLQTAPLTAAAFLCFALAGSYALLSLERKIRLSCVPGVLLLTTGLALLTLGVFHWLSGYMTASWPKSSWATLLPRPLGGTSLSSSARPYPNWIPKDTRTQEVWVPRSKPSVIFILVESLRRDLLTRHPSVIPFLTELAREGVVFDKAYAPATHSDYSDLSVWYSRYPLLSGTRTVWRMDDPRRGRSAFTVFKAMGYSTAYISSQNEKWGNMIAWLKVPEVDYFFHSEDFVGKTWENWDDLPGLVRLIKSGVATAGKVEDSETLRVALRWIDSQRVKGPLFLGINLQNTHFHYVYPPGARRPFQPDELDFPAVYYTWPKEKVEVVRNRYLNAVHNLDLLLKWFAEELGRRGLWDDTFFVVAGDNGEAFYEHGFANHSGPMYEECVRTLVVMKPPRGIRPAAPMHPVNLVDLIPGILDLMGVEPSYDFQGVSPFAEPHPRPEVYLHSYGFVLQDGIVAWPWKLLVTRWPDTRFELYNLEEDPGETQNLWEKDVARAERLARLLFRFREEQLAYWLFRENWSRYFPPRFLTNAGLVSTTQSGRWRPQP